MYEVEAAEVEARELVRVAMSQEDWGRVLKYQQRWALLDVFSAAVAAGDDAASAVERRLIFFVRWKSWKLLSVATAMAMGYQMTDKGSGSMAALLVRR